MKNIVYLKNISNSMIVFGIRKILFKINNIKINNIYHFL